MNEYCADNVRWLIQVPRLFDIYRINNCVENFQVFFFTETHEKETNRPFSFHALINKYEKAVLPP